MSSKSESGHVTNLWLAKEIISICEGYGGDYQPTNPLISLLSMKSITDNAESLHRIYTEKQMKYKTGVNAKEAMVKRLKFLTKKSIHFYESTGATKEQLESAKVYLRKITGSNVRKKRDENHRVLPGQISNCQMGVDNLMDNFDKLLCYLAMQEEYSPMEPEIKVVNLQAFLDELNAMVEEVFDLKTANENAMIARDNCMYMEGTGLVDVTLLCKKYVGSVFGARSEKAKLVMKLKLRRMMKLKKEGS
jgi:hypothetical protein